MRSPRRPVRRPVRRLATVAVLALVGVAAVACDDGGAPEPKLSADGAKGKLVAQKFNCQSCHSTDGSELAGPSWKDLYGTEITLKGGKQLTVDAAYIEQSVRDPSSQRRDDATGVMPMFDEDRISDADLASIVAYIEDLGGAGSQSGTGE